MTQKNKKATKNSSKQRKKTSFKLSKQQTIIWGVFLFLLGQAAGEESTISMLQGFALGVGYALQPYIVSLLSGATYFSTGMLKAGDQILIEKDEYKIISNGVLYIEAENITKNIIVYVPNGYFNQIH